MFLLVCPVFSYIPAISFHHRLIAGHLAVHTTRYFTVFDYSDVLLDIVVGGAAALIKRRTCRRGEAIPARS